MSEEDYGAYGLECLKPAYGLADVPLAWQMTLHQFLEEHGGVQSLLDDCLWHYKNSDGTLKGVITTHVDDLAIACRQTFLDEQHQLLTKKFGKISLQMTPLHSLRSTLLQNSQWLQDGPAGIHQRAQDPRDRGHQEW